MQTPEATSVESEKAPVYAPPAILWEQEFVALALVSDVCSVPDPTSQNCQP